MDRDENGIITGHRADKEAARGWNAVSKISSRGYRFMREATEYMLLVSGDGKGFSDKRKERLHTFAE